MRRARIVIGRTYGTRGVPSRLVHRATELVQSDAVAAEMARVLVLVMRPPSISAQRAFTGTQVRAVKWKDWKFHYAFQPEPRPRPIPGS